MSKCEKCDGTGRDPEHNSIIIVPCSKCGGTGRISKFIKHI